VGRSERTPPEKRERLKLAKPWTAKPGMKLRNQPEARNRNLRKSIGNIVEDYTTAGPSVTLSPFPRLPGVAGYTGSCSADFATGRGGLLQLLGASLSSCCRYYPARVSRRIGQLATFHAAFALSTGARPLRRKVSRSPVRLLPLRPNDSLTIPRMALSIDSRGSVSFPPGYPSYNALTFALVRLPPPNSPSLRCRYVGSGCGAVPLSFTLFVAPPFLWGVPHEPTRRPVPSPRRIKPTVQISRSGLSCLLRNKVYETGGVG